MSNPTKKQPTDELSAATEELITLVRYISSCDMGEIDAVIEQMDNAADLVQRLANQEK